MDLSTDPDLGVTSEKEQTKLDHGENNQPKVCENISLSIWFNIVSFALIKTHR
jgi:hypothetical protein